MGKTMIARESVLLFLFLIGCAIFCRKDISKIMGAPFTYQDEYYDGIGSYFFPDGVYARYTRFNPYTGHYNANEILLGLHYKGISIREAWEIVAVRSSHYNPSLILLLKDRFQPIDTLQFRYSDKPKLTNEAKIRHYVFF